MTKCDICKQEGKTGGSHFMDVKGNHKFACWKEKCQKICNTESNARDKWEIDQLRKKGLCIFGLAWVGYCGENGYWKWEGRANKFIKPPVKAIPGSDCCEEHSKIKCSNAGCNNPAIGQCDYCGQFVCGYPYCAKCGEHFGHR